MIRNKSQTPILRPREKRNRVCPKGETVVSARKKHAAPYPFLPGSRNVAILGRKNKTYPISMCAWGRAAIIWKFQNTDAPNP